MAIHDMIDGPCACGAWHKPADIAAALDGTLKDRDQRIAALEAAVAKAEGERDAAQKRFEAYADLNDEVIADNEDLRTQLTARDGAGAEMMRDMESIRVRCVEGDRGVDWLPMIRGIAEHALATAPAAWRK